MIICEFEVIVSIKFIYSYGDLLLARSKTREEIAADAAHVDLRSRSPYFYELGCKIALL